MPVPLDVFKSAMEEVKILYQEGCELSKKHNCPKPQFNNLIRNVVNKMRLPCDDSADLVHELAKFFGRRGGKKQPRKSRSKKPKKKMPKAVVVDSQTQLDMINMARQANEHICPVD